MHRFVAIQDAADLHEWTFCLRLCETYKEITWPVQSIRGEVIRRRMATRVRGIVIVGIPCLKMPLAAWRRTIAALPYLLAHVTRFWR